MKMRSTDPRATVVTYAFFHAFKFPDSMAVQIRCKVEICRFGCPDHCGASSSSPAAAGYSREQEVVTSLNGYGSPIAAPQQQQPASGSYSAPVSSGNTYSAPVSSGNTYSAPVSSGNTYSAPVSSGNAYSSPVSNAGSTYSAGVPTYQAGRRSDPVKIAPADDKEAKKENVRPPPPPRRRRLRSRQQVKRRTQQEV